MNKIAHMFAIYYPSFHVPPDDQELLITDASIVHRITKVLRLEVGGTFILFDRFINAELMISKIDRRAVTCKIKQLEKNKLWQPPITFLLPILKREALGAAIYSLVEAGVNEIQLINSDKVQRKFGDTKEMRRLERIIITAAEQSKNFAFPIIKPPISLKQALALVKDVSCYVGNPQGMAVRDFITRTAVLKQCALLVGPEGDFSPKEKKLLEKESIVSLKLTPTILRSESAAFYLAALFRSVFLA